MVQGPGQAGKACDCGSSVGSDGKIALCRIPKTLKPTERGFRFGTCSRTFLMKKRLSSLRALIFMRHGNFDTEKVSVTFSCVRIFYFSRKLQSSNDLINAGCLGQVWRSCQFGLAGAVRRRGWGCRQGGQPPTGGLPSWGRAFPHSF